MSYRWLATRTTTSRWVTWDPQSPIGIITPTTLRRPGPAKPNAQFQLVHGLPKRRITNSRNRGKDPLKWPLRAQSRRRGRSKTPQLQTQVRAPRTRVHRGESVPNATGAIYHRMWITMLATTGRSIRPPRPTPNAKSKRRQGEEAKEVKVLA